MAILLKNALKNSESLKEQLNEILRIKDQPQQTKREKKQESARSSLGEKEQNKNWWSIKAENVNVADTINV